MAKMPASQAAHALIISTAVALCGALIVDFKDSETRRTRVVYDPEAEGVSAVHASSAQNGRRLESEDILTAGDDTVVIAASPDTMFIYQNDTARIIYCTDLEINELLFSPFHDLEVRGGIITLPEQMRFEPPHASTGKNHKLYIHALQLVVPEAGADIDVSGADGETPGHGIAADNGHHEGQDGSNGANGQEGGVGGVVVLEVGSIVGGKLVIRVNGGAGSDGQDAGNGRRGAEGAQVDSENCCNKKSSAGNSGQKGGDAGSGGTGGTGGKPGRVWVAFTTFFDASDAPVPAVTIANDAGGPGASGKAGKRGSGGPGGPGSPSKCTRIGMTRQKRCFLPLGPSGVAGPTGLQGRNGLEGEHGKSADQDAVSVKSMALQDLRKGHCGPQLEYDMWLADKKYMHGDYTTARDLYNWIAAVRNTTADDCKSSIPWIQVTLQASVRLSQMSLGLNFWGHQVDHTPLLSYEGLHSTAASLIKMAFNAEEAFDQYYSKAVSYDKRIELIKKEMKNMDYEIGHVEQKMDEVVEQITSARIDVAAYDASLIPIERLLTETGADCDIAMKEKTAREHYGWRPTVNRLITFAKYTVTASKDLVLTLLAHQATLVATYSLVNTFAADTFADGKEIVQDGSIASKYDFLLLLGGPVLQTFKTQVDTIKKVKDDSITKLNRTWLEIKQQVEKVEGKEELNAKVRTLTESMYGEEIVEFAQGIPECTEFGNGFGELITIYGMKDSKVGYHDDLVLKYAALTVERSKLSERRSQFHKNSAEHVDPMVIEHAITMGHSYYRMKAEIVEVLKQLQEAMDYEFCDRTAFSVEDARVLQLESYLAEITTQKLRKKADDFRGRAVVAHNPYALVHGHREHSTASTVLKINMMDTSKYESFREYQKSGKFLINIFEETPALPHGVANVRIVSAQVFVPALMKANGGNHDIAQVWLRRLGVSQCINPLGESRRFSHSENSYYSMYNAQELGSDGKPKWLSQQQQREDEVGPTPVGTWEISMPSLTSVPERQMVQDIELHFILSYVPCAKPDCGGRQDVHMSAASRPGSVKTTLASGSQSYHLLLAGLVACTAAFTLAAAAVVSQRNKGIVEGDVAVGSVGVRCPQQEEQVDNSICARGHALRRAPLVTIEAECQ